MARVKYLGKRALFALPTPLGRAAVTVACASGLVGLSYLAYFKLGRPSRIISGPFRGMPYLPIAAGSQWMPKLLGSYESELHPTLAVLMGEPCDLLVDVGVAEGYYAVGLARALDVPKVYGFDVDPYAREMFLKIAALNGLADRAVARGFCRAEELNELLRPSAHPLLIIDCEGGEVDVLDPVAAPELKRARLVVEIHGSEVIGKTMRERFGDTHHIEGVAVQPRTVAEFPASHAGELTDAEKESSMFEWRPPMAGWLVFRPKGA